MITNDYACILTGGADYGVGNIETLNITNCAINYSGGYSTSSGNFKFVCLGNGIYTSVSSIINIDGLYVYQPTLLDMNTYKNVAVIGFTQDTTLNINQTYLIMSDYMTNVSGITFNVVQNILAGFSYNASNVYTNCSLVDPGGDNSLPNLSDSSGFYFNFTNWTSSNPGSAAFPSFNTSNIPYTLTALTQSPPFNPSAYTSYITNPQLINIPPCIQKGMRILTSTGYKKVEHLKETDRLRTPCHRTVPIDILYHTKIVGSKRTVPYCIPKDYFCTNVPNMDTYISSNHAVFGNGKWHLPYRLPGVKPCKDKIGEIIEYYHIALPEYEKDKIVCNNMPIDSWDVHQIEYE
jgi:hypothetical protein